MVKRGPIVSRVALQSKLQQKCQLIVNTMETRGTANEGLRARTRRKVSSWVAIRKAPVSSFHTVSRQSTELDSRVSAS